MTTNFPGGFRLQRFEIYNWGTFHKKVWVLQHGGFSTLLTGKNGSGKSTIVDGILTLLVPNNKRNYNLSSGSDRRERSEKTYALGAYGREKNEFHQGQTKYLRSKGDYSVLLGVFKNEVSGELLTLAQLFWYDQTELKKIFVVSHRDLSIAQDFSDIEHSNALKQRLKSYASTMVYSTFSEYEAYFIKFFGLRSAKAMGLFNQVTSIKEVGRLNDFVRSHMLDYQDPSELLSQLYGNYENLRLSHEAIVLAQRQLLELEPLCQSGDKLKELEGELAQQDLIRKFTPGYYQQEKLTLVTSALQGTQGLATAATEQMQLIDGELYSLNIALKKLQAMLKGDGLEAIKNELDLKIKNHQELLKVRQNVLNAYLKVTKELGLPGPVTPKVFVQHADFASEIIEKSQQCSSQLRDAQFKLRSEYEQAAKVLEEANQGYQVLKRQKGKIPYQLSACRDRLATYLDVGKNKLPFVGELVRVKEQEKSWTLVIERVMRSFALRLLVPAERYKDVNKFLKNNNLGVKLVYERVEATGSRRANGAKTENNSQSKLIDKLDFSPVASANVQWVIEKIRHNFDYVCTESLSEFNTLERAITPEGLIKRSFTLHEKDDRSSGDNNRQSDILGWENEDDLRRLHLTISTITTEQRDRDVKIKGLLAEESATNKRIELARRLGEFKEFAAINVDFHYAEIDRLSQEKSKLSSKVGKAGDEHRHFEKVQKDQEAKLFQRDGLLSELAVLKNQLEVLSQDKAFLEKAIGEIAIDAGVRQAVKTKIEGLLKREKISKEVKNYRDFDVMTAKVISLLEGEHRLLAGKKSGLMTSLIKKMATFKATFSEHCANLDSSIEYLETFYQMRDSLKRESLPQHEKRFKLLLSKSVVNDMQAFKSSLDIWYENIEEDVDQLNSSLRLISYSSETYVQLKVNRTRDTDVREFQNLLRLAIDTPASTNTTAVVETSFERIRELLDRMSKMERWRTKVTDVRNWADFFVVELAKADHSERNFYSDSSGLSGGQKAKLAFTILASSIAYQYGLHSDKNSTKSFRFVVIDEAFSKSDEDNSRFAMELFANLGLQLMVITPRDKIQIAEPYIQSIFHTTMDEDLNNSKVYTVAIQDRSIEKEPKAKTTNRLPAGSRLIETSANE